MISRHEVQRALFDILTEGQWWNAGAIADYQRKQLAPLLRHASAHVPFYSNRLGNVINSNGDINWDRWTDIPIVRREDVVQHGKGMLARELPAEHGNLSRASTSGTSGPALSFITTEKFSCAVAAARYLGYQWHSIDTSDVLLAIRGDDPATAYPNGKDLGGWGPPWLPESASGRYFHLARTTTVPQLAEYLSRHGASYLATGPKTAVAIALEMETRGLTWDFDAFLPHGSAVSDEDRRIIQQAFGARTADLYSSKEGGHMGHACPNGTGIHIHEEVVFVEIVDEHGRAVPEGVAGRVIVTPLHNWAQPLIRYDQGDIATWLDAPCPCGRSLRRIDKVIGRSSALFYHPDGRVRSAFLGQYRPLLHTNDWQIAQTGPTQFEVRYVPPEAGPAPDESALVERLRETYFEDAEVTFVKLSSVPLTPAGKPLEYVNEWRPTVANR